MKEIERKFLVKDQTFYQNCRFDQIQQTYLFNESNKSLRIRIKNDVAYLTIKGNQIGITRDEFEYEIPKGEALEIIDRFDLKVLSKKRYYLNSGNLTWEIDVFEGKLVGLLVAEIELPSEDFEIDIPSWVGEEVTSDPSYLNAELFKKL
jgi:CYTH domain-containing protein